MLIVEKKHNSTVERYEYIDIMRGIAVLFVVYQHTAEINLNSAMPMNWWEEIIIIFFTKTIGIGEIGVCIFFIISGFVVPFSLFRYRHQPIKNFIANRFLRIFPAYWLSVPLGLIFVYWRFGHLYGGQEINWSVAITNLSMFQGFVGVENLMGQYWTLPLELLFYAVCAVLFSSKCLDSIKAAIFLLIGFFLLREVTRHVPQLDKNVLGIVISLRYVGFMFFGLFFRKWLLEKDRTSGIKAVWVLVVTFLAFGAVNNILELYRGNIFALRVQGNHLVAIAIFCVFTRLHKLSSRIGIFLGKISYSIYLFHPVIFYPLFLFWFQSSPLRSNPHIFIFTSIFLTIAFSYLTYRYVEKPFIDFGKKRFSGNPDGGW